MGLIHVPRFRHTLPSLKRPFRYAGIILGLFLLANAAVWAVYRTRLYPQTHLLTAAVGNVSYGSISRIVGPLDVLPDSLQFVYGNTQASMTLADLGITKDVTRSVQGARQRRSWLPVVDLFRRIDLPAPIAINTAAYDQASEHLSEVFGKLPVDSVLAINGDTVAIQPEADGYKLDTVRLKQLVYAGLDAGGRRITVPVIPVKPKIKIADLGAERDNLVRQLSSSITIRYSGKVRQPSKNDIAGWFVRSGSTYAVSAELVRSYVVSTGTGFGIKVQNADQVASGIADTVRQARSADITLTAMPIRKKYVYCVSAKDVGAEYLATLKDKLLATLNDGRGWSLDGAVSFTEATNACNFTVWLSSADQMPTFGAICDSIWSCRVGTNVVINFDRWQGASSAWNAAGGSLDDYRNMVINHEVGHWLGFGHRHCGGAGQPAPIMQQQSINLEGCTFNPWPTSLELADFRAKLGF